MIHVLPDASGFGPGSTSRSPDETLVLGGRAARLLRGGETLLLWGPLGAGKTLFAQGLCRELGVTCEVTSPTFTLANRYDGRLVVHHLDFYRLDGEDDLHDIGLDSVLEEVEDGGAVLLAEWPDPLLPWLGSRLEFLVTPGAEVEERVWRLRGVPDLPDAWRGFLDGGDP